MNLVCYESFQTLMEEFGCTTPFGPNQSNICSESLINKSAWEKADSLLYQNPMNMAKHCPKSCIQAQSSFGSFEKSTSYQNLLKLNFKQFVKVSKADYSFKLISFIAEVGGYVGLFLGVSINQLSFVLESLYKFIKHTK